MIRTQTIALKTVMTDANVAKLTADGIGVDLTQINTVKTTRRTVDDPNPQYQKNLNVRLCPKVCKLLEPCYSDYRDADLEACKKSEEWVEGDPPTCENPISACEQDMKRIAKREFKVSYLIDKAEPIPRYQTTTVTFQMMEEDGTNCFSAAGRIAPAEWAWRWVFAVGLAAWLLVVAA